MEMVIQVQLDAQVACLQSRLSQVPETYAPQGENVPSLKTRS